MENQEQIDKKIVPEEKKQEPIITNLFEDMNKHKHDHDSYEKMIAEKK